MKTWEYRYLESSDDLMELVQGDVSPEAAEAILNDLGIVDAQEQQAALDDFEAGNQSHESYRTVSSALHEMADKGAPPAVRAAAVLIDSILHATADAGANSKRKRDEVWRLLNLGEDKQPKEMRDLVLSALVDMYTDPGNDKVWTVDALANDEESPLRMSGIPAGAITRVRKNVSEPPEIFISSVGKKDWSEEKQLLALCQYWQRKIA